MSVSALGKTSTYIGHFEVTDVEIKYVTDKTWSEFRDMGSIVYFMYVKDRLMKIGIAGAVKAVGMDALACTKLAQASAVMLRTDSFLKS
jgi:hypothetical protein